MLTMQVTTRPPARLSTPEPETELDVTTNDSKEALPGANTTAGKA